MARTAEDPPAARLPGAFQWGERTEREGVVCREFVLQPAAGVAHGGPEAPAAGDPRPVPGVLWQAAAPRAGAPLIAFGHGASGDRHQAPIPYLARRLVRDHGGAAIAIDGPVHGQRRQGDGARGAFWKEWARAGTVDDMIADWRRVLDAALALPELAASPLGYWGLSMGTIYGAPLVAAEPRIRAAVLGLMGISGPNEAYLARIAADAARIEVPVLFLLQLEDELFTRAQCLALFDAFASPDKRIHAHPGAHAAVPVEDIDHSLMFLVARLDGAMAGNAASDASGRGTDGTGTGTQQARPDAAATDRPTEPPLDPTDREPTERGPTERGPTDRGPTDRGPSGIG